MDRSLVIFGAQPELAGPSITPSRDCTMAKTFLGLGDRERPRVSIERGGDQEQ
jgi:hypothetical protein